MLKDFKGALTRLLLAVALLCASAAVGLAAPRGRSSADACPLMSRKHACCKKARQGADAPRLVPVRLCCIANTPQPAPAGTAYSVRPAPGVATDPSPAVNAVEPAPDALHTRAPAPTFSPTHSPPAYIRHVSFLI